MPLNSEGRCVLTELWPDQCSCRDHRNSPEILAPDFASLQVAQAIEARYVGRCAMDSRHVLKPEDEIHLVTTVVEGDEPLGWVCKACAKRVIDGG
jgi:hypothetical protein